MRIIDSFDDHWVETSGPLETPCWIWQRSTDHCGYGKFTADSKTYFAHRHSYELYAGPIREGLCILHDCDTPSCVNPKHLYQGTQLQNIRDRVSRGRCASTAGSKHPRSRITPQQATEIIEGSIAKELSQKELSHIHNMSQQSVSAIVCGDHWTQQ